MNLKELRGWLTRELRAQVPDEIWEMLVEDRTARPGLQKGDVELEDLKHEAQKLLRACWIGKASGRGSKPPGRDALEERAGPIAVDLANAERLRAHVFSQLTASMAENRPDVQQFRESYLEGKLLTEDEAGTFLAEHGEYTGVNSPVLKELRWLGEQLAKDYRWQREEAMWFVLAGGTPPVSPLRAVGSVGYSKHGPHRAAITLTIEPWVDAKEVDRVYRDIQRQMLGNDNLLIGEKRLRLLEFVEDQKRTGTGGWRTLMQRWNETYPQWKYEDKEHPDHAVRYFKRSYDETYERLMYPNYHFPKWKRYTPTPRQSWRNTMIGANPAST